MKRSADPLPGSLTKEAKDWITTRAAYMRTVLRMDPKDAMRNVMEEARKQPWLKK